MLAVAGLVLLVAGVLVLAGGLDLYGRLHLDMPQGWPLTSPDQPVVSYASRTRWTDKAWWWPTVITVLVLAVAGALWWLFAQLHRSGPSTVTLPAPGAGLVLRLRTSALEDALETETIALPEVARVRVKLTGGSRRPLVRAAVRLEAGGGPAGLVERFHTGPLAHARDSLGLPELPAELRLGVAGRRRATPRHPRVL
ncbi:alkaline shock response membrane anchor protein AmaP [Kitasatospora atroaurantiaca]